MAPREDWVTKMRTTLGIVVVVSLASCIAADGFLNVKGRLVDQFGSPIDSCVLQLHAAGNGELLGSSRVGGDFEATFGIAPWSKKYYLQAICPRDSSTFKTPDFKSNGSKYYRNPMELGTIVLRAKL